MVLEENLPDKKKEKSPYLRTLFL
ncbi:hypothetical protein PT2222_120158 [Paraburkholderia tropica]